MERPDWDNQFRETSDEITERWRRIKAQRRAEGKCWQCAKLIAICDCPNVVHKRTAT
jgi:hypothetical protein